MESWIDGGPGSQVLPVQEPMYFDLCVRVCLENTFMHEICGLWTETPYNLNVRHKGVPEGPICEPSGIKTYWLGTSSAPVHW